MKRPRRGGGAVRRREGRNARLGQLGEGNSGSHPPRKTLSTFSPDRQGRSSEFARVEVGRKRWNSPGVSPTPSLEDAAEVALVAEPDLGRHALDRPAGGSEEYARPLDPQPMDVLGEGLAESHAVGGPEVVGERRARRRSQVGVRQM